MLIVAGLKIGLNIAANSDLIRTVEQGMVVGGMELKLIQVEIHVAMPFYLHP